MRSKSQLDLGLGSLQKRLSAGTGKSPTSQKPSLHHPASHTESRAMLDLSELQLSSIILQKLHTDISSPFKSSTDRLSSAKLRQARICDKSLTTMEFSRAMLSKFNENEQKLRLFFSKVDSNRRYNLAKCVGTWKMVGGRLEKTRRQQGNGWFRRAAHILAKNSRLSLQKSLWRLRPDDYVPIHRRTQIRCFNITLMPTGQQQTDNEARALLQLQSLVKNEQLHSIIRKFQQQANQKQTIKKYFYRVGRNTVENVRMAMSKIGMMGCVKKVRDWENIKQRMRAFIVRALRGRLIVTLGCLKEQAERGRHKKKASAYRLATTTKLTLQKCLSLLQSSVHQHKLLIRISSLAHAFQSMNEGISRHVGKHLNPCKQDLQKAAICFESLSRILMRNQLVTLSRVFHRMKREWMERGGDNVWYVKAPRILALRSSINEQKSLWRMRQNIQSNEESKPNLQKLPTPPRSNRSSFRKP